MPFTNCCARILNAPGLCYVDDMIEGFVRMMDSELGFTGPINRGILIYSLCWNFQRAS
jgi:hypothetical protein